MEVKMTFEEAMQRLVRITEMMEDANRPLEEMSALYKEGTGLYRFCRDALDMTEKELLVLSEEEV